MPFGKVGRMSPGMRHVVGFGYRSMGSGITVGATYLLVLGLACIKVFLHYLQILAGVRPRIHYSISSLLADPSRCNRYSVGHIPTGLRPRNHYSIGPLVADVRCCDRYSRGHIPTSVRPRNHYSIGP